MEHQFRLSPAADRRPSTPDIIAASANRSECRQTAAGNQPHIAAQPPRYLVDQRQASLKELLGAVDFEPQQFAHASARSLVAEPILIDAESFEIFPWHIDSAHLSIATYILAKIR